jgi:hypothetical protein
VHYTTVSTFCQGGNVTKKDFELIASTLALIKLMSNEIEQEMADRVIKEFIESLKQEYSNFNVDKFINYINLNLQVCGWERLIYEETEH